MSRMYTQTPLNFRIIGFDPGYDRMGISVLDHKNGKEFLIYSACFETNKKMGFADRLVEIDGAVQSAIKTWEPKVAALETLFFSKNTRRRNIPRRRRNTPYLSEGSLFEFSMMQ